SNAGGAPRPICAFLPPSRSATQPPLSPYTTLFRSDTSDRRVGRALAAAAASGALGFGADYPHPIPALVLIAPLPVLLAALRSSADRKTTRLNSSHVSISYAVFCLKKKNISLVWLAL